MRMWGPIMSHLLNVSSYLLFLSCARLDLAYRVGLAMSYLNNQSPQPVLFRPRDNSEVFDLCRMYAASLEYSFLMFFPTRV